MTDRRLLTFTDTTTIDDDFGPVRLTVVATLHQIEGNERPHWSLTCSGRQKGIDVFGGADHDTILRHWPGLAPIAALHLSDDLGVPMYAVENGLYWLGMTSFPDARSLPTFAGLWRCDVAEASAIRGRCELAESAKEQLVAEADAQAPRWFSESEAAKELLVRLGAK